MDPDAVVGTHFRMYRSTAGYVQLDVSDGVELTGQDAHEVIQALASLANGTSPPLLVDGRTARALSREAREVFARDTVPSRVALLAGSSLSRVIANFYIGVARPSVPTRMFTDLDDAERWLLDDG